MIWIKPSGMEVKTNDLPDTIEYVKSLGWKEKKEPNKEEVKKVVKKKKAEK